MNYLLEEITREKMSASSEVGYIQRLQQLSDKGKGKKLDLFHFTQTGRIYPLNNYLSKFNIDRWECHPDTKHVLVYVLGYKIDMLNNKTYVINVEGKEVVSNSVKELEQRLYEYFCNNSSTKVAQ